MRRFITLFLSTFLLFSLGTVNCSSEPEEGEDTELTDQDLLLILFALRPTSCSQGVAGCSSGTYSCDESSRCYFSEGDCVNSGDCGLEMQQTSIAARNPDLLALLDFEPKKK